MLLPSRKKELVVHRRGPRAHLVTDQLQPAGGQHRRAGPNRPGPGGRRLTSGRRSRLSLLRLSAPCFFKRRCFSLASVRPNRLRCRRRRGRCPAGVRGRWTSPAASGDGEAWRQSDDSAELNR